MTKSNTDIPILDGDAVAEIEAQLEASSPGGALSVERMKLMTAFEAQQREYVRALCATVRALRAENEIYKAADYSALTSDVDDFRSRAIALCRDKADEWAKQSEEAQAHGIQSVADGKTSRALAAQLIANELEQLK